MNWKDSKLSSVPNGAAALDAWLALRPSMAAKGKCALFVSCCGTPLTPNQLRNRLQAQ